MKNTVKITSKKEIIETKEVSFPAFFVNKSSNKHIALYGEGKYMTVLNFSDWKKEELNNQFPSDFTDMIQITEEEFNRARVKYAEDIIQAINDATVQNIG